MKFTYPAIIKKTEKGTYHATFPDLICCEAEGDTLEETVELANEAATGLAWNYQKTTENFLRLPISVISY